MNFTHIEKISLVFMCITLLLIIALVIWYKVKVINYIKREQETDRLNKLLQDKRLSNVQKDALKQFYYNEFVKPNKK